MNGNKDFQRPGTNNSNNNNNHVRPDDEYDDDGSGVEDDAPESFQAMVVSEPPWATFPDLLRVPTSTNNNTAAEDDSPESLSFAATQSFRSNEPSSAYRSVTANSLSQGTSINNTPRNRRSFPHPDVSQTEQSNLPSASSRNFQSSSSSRPGSSTAPADYSWGPAPTSSLRPLPSLPSTSSRLESNELDHPNRIAHHPHRSPINSLNLSSALHSSSYSFHPPSSSSSLSSSLNLSLAPITNALAQVQSSIDALSRQVNERLDALENRINNLDSVSSPINLNPSCSTENNGVNTGTNNSRDISSEYLKIFIKEQRKEMRNESRAFILSFADALKNAVDSTNRQEPSASGSN